MFLFTTQNRFWFIRNYQNGSAEICPVLWIHNVHCTGFTAYRKFEITTRVLFSRNLRSFVKIKSWQNAEITLLFTDICKTCHRRKFLASQMCLLTLFGTRKFPNLQYFRICASHRIYAYRKPFVDSVNLQHFIRSISSGSVLILLRQILIFRERNTL